MVGCCLATSTLLGLAGAGGANKPIDCEIFSMFSLHRTVICVFFGGISWVSFCELKLGLAFAATY